MEIITRGSSTIAYSVCLSIIPSLLQSTSFTILPWPGFFPNEPIISTPTYTSPEAATARQAGLGVRSGPEKPIMFRSAGQLSLADIESMEASAGFLGCGSHGGLLSVQPAIKKAVKRTEIIFFI